MLRGRKGKHPLFIRTTPRAFQTVNLFGGIPRDGNIFRSPIRPSSHQPIRLLPPPAPNRRALSRTFAFTWRHASMCAPQPMWSSVIPHPFLLYSRLTTEYRSALALLSGTRVCLLSLASSGSLPPYFSYGSGNGLMDGRMRGAVLLPSSRANCIVAAHLSLSTRGSFLVASSPGG